MKKYVGLGALCLFLLGGLAVGAYADFNLTQGLYNPQNGFAIFMEAFGYWPLYMPTALMLASYAVLAKSPLLKCGSAILSAVTLSVLGYMSFHYVQKRNAIEMSFIIFIGIAIVLVPIFMHRRRMDIMQKLFFMGAFGFVYMLCNNAVVNVLKIVWQRPRYDDMLAEGTLSSFAPWYNIMGEGGSSFPSGHTAAACGVFVLLVLCSLFPRLSRYRATMLVACFAFVFAMAFGRMIIGRHFLSDTVMATFIGYGLFELMTKTKIYQKTLANTLVVASEAKLI